MGTLEMPSLGLELFVELALIGRSRDLGSRLFIEFEVSFLLSSKYHNPNKDSLDSFWDTYTSGCL